MLYPTPDFHTIKTYFLSCYVKFASSKKYTRHTYCHFAAKTFRRDLRRIKWFHFSIIEQEPLITPLGGGAVKDEAVVVPPLRCTSVNYNSNQLVPVT